MSDPQTVTIIRNLIGLEIAAVVEDMRKYPEDRLWWTPAGISNSGGVLAQHLAGNLNHFIGQGLGNTGYVRDRQSEFEAHEASLEQLVAALESAQATVDTVLGGLEASQLDAPFPIQIPIEANTLGFILFLYRHLAYHHGQINYLRRIASETPA